MDDTGAYKVEISNESGAASGAFKMKVVSKLFYINLHHVLCPRTVMFSFPVPVCPRPV